MTTDCPHNGAHPDRADDGIDQIDGRFQQVRHPTEGFATFVDSDGEKRCRRTRHRCSGFLYDGVKMDGTRAHAMVRRCEHPGHQAGR